VWWGGDLLNLARLAGRRRLHLFGVECGEQHVSAARSKGIEMFNADIERQRIDAGDGFFDIVTANQLLEHTKEIFWIFAEISRTLKSGGMLIIGVPNLASLHNRILLLFGEQPSAVDVLGPHVRGFTPPALRRFVETDGYFEVVKIRGGNFYPFPRLVSQALSRAFPTMAVAIFLLARRTGKQGSFIDVLRSRCYDTAYFTGEGT
jgi:SAM-dependent methyltransferase